jgi:hypothetical protein
MIRGRLGVAVAKPEGVLMRTGIVSAFVVVVAGGLLAACGGDDDGGEESSEPVTIESATACLEDAGAKVQEIEVSLIEPPADLRAQFPRDETVVVWVEDTEEDAAQVIESANELNELGGDSESAEPPTQVGNAAYDPFADSASEETQAAVEGCLS